MSLHCEDCGGWGVEKEIKKYILKQPVGYEVYLCNDCVNGFYKFKIAPKTEGEPAEGGI